MIIKPDHYEKEKVHVLYRCFNRRKSLLYIGITNNPRQRFAQHKSQKVWWKYVDHIKLEHFETRQHLEDAERNAIAKEKPIFNIACGTKDIESAPQTSYRNRKARPLWGDASAFCTVQQTLNVPKLTIEQRLYPCCECSARAIYCESETVFCAVCAAEWAFDDWFFNTFGRTVKVC